MGPDYGRRLLTAVVGPPVEGGLAPAPCPGLPGCLLQALPAGYRIPAILGARPMPALKGLLEVSIQGLLGQWVSLEGCPCPDRLWALPLLLPSQIMPLPPVLVATPRPLSSPLSWAVRMRGR